METTTKKHLNNLNNTDKVLRYVSFQHIMKLTDQPVDWAYEVWDGLLILLKEGDNHQRTMAVQLLSNLTKSDPQQRMLIDFERLMSVTKDEKFVTARHSLQALWKIGIVSETCRNKVIEALSKRFEECSTEKNGTLIRYDIIEVFRKMYDEVEDEKLRDTAVALIETEDDAKYRKKYSAIWKDILKGQKINFNIQGVT
ncbi:hypothetical protein [Catalinimonas niigatensis]|uniref:hypothetical protein n=1 Tax=Catalinimonas niigatensis TaxID=1397264 RepID=UPI0026668EBD|nr:hypothetical protein [Catalinimonas niigatensis]WPP52117.1 hypothetical protein PZB72_06955 [Catalinimonas niigatensis]